MKKINFKLAAGPKTKERRKEEATRSSEDELRTAINKRIKEMALINDSDLINTVSQLIIIELGGINENTPGSIDDFSRPTAQAVKTAIKAFDAMDDDAFKKITLDQRTKVINDPFLPGDGAEIDVLEESSYSGFYKEENNNKPEM